MNKAIVTSDFTSLGNPVILMFLAMVYKDTYETGEG